MLEGGRSTEFVTELTTVTALVKGMVIVVENDFELTEVSGKIALLTIYGPPELGKTTTCFTSVLVPASISKDGIGSTGSTLITVSAAASASN